MKNDLMSIVDKAEARYGLPKGLLRGVAQAESNWNPSAKSRVGALGLMQIMPATAKELGVNPLDPSEAADGAARYLAKNLKKFGTQELALAAYNAGPGNVQKHGGVPPFKETRQYIQKVTANMKPKEANPFDQFDAAPAKEANPFDQFDNAPQAAAPQTDSVDFSLNTDKVKTVGQGIKDAVGGVARSGMGIASNLMRPFEAMIPGGDDGSSGHESRMARVEGRLKGKGYDTDSNTFKGVKLGADVLATLPVGGALGKLAGKAGLPALQTALATGGFRTGLPAATTKAGKVGQMALRSGAGATGAAGAGLLVSPENTGTAATIGAFLPPALAGAGKVAHATGAALRGGGATPEVQALATRAKELGINIPADRIANSRPMNALASSLNYVPFSGRAATEKNMTNELTRAATKLIGQDSDNMAIALRKASDDLGGKFDSTLKTSAVKLDENLLTDIVSVDDIARQQLGDSDYKAIASQVAELLKKGDSGAIDGQAAYNIKRTLDRMGRTNTPAAFHALELKKALMAGLDRSLGPEKAKAFAKTREQYGNMLDLEKIVLNGAEGDISVARLAGMKNINNKPLQEIADISAQFVKTREGNHGAMQRVGAGLGLGTMAGPAWLLGGAVAGAGTNKLLNSNAARSFAMKQPGGTNQLVNRLAPALYRSAPVLASDR